MNNTAYDNYIEKITNIFLTGIKNKNLKFQKRWKPTKLMQDEPHNPVTKKHYKGLNSLMLDIVQDANSYNNNIWLTFNQIKQLGGTVRKGQRGTPIAYFTKIQKEEIKDEKGEILEIREIELKNPLFKQYTVFNLNQTDLDIEQFKELYKDGLQISNFNDINEIENIKSNLDLELVHKNIDRAYYTPTEDKIYLPMKEQFRSQSAYYSTFLHELGHATGHEKRLNRKELFSNYSSSKESRAREELRAEIYSYLQAKDLGIDLEIQNHQSYVNSWTKLLSENKKELIEAIKDSFHMMKFVKENYIKDTFEHKKVEKEKVQEVENDQKSFEVVGAIARSFTKSYNHNDIEQKKEDWTILKNNKNEAIELLKEYIKQSEEELKDTENFDKFELRAIKEDIEGYKLTINSLERKNPLKEVENKRENTPTLKKELSKIEQLQNLENITNLYSNEKIEKEDYQSEKEKLVNELLNFKNEKELTKTFKELERRVNINQDEKDKFNNGDRVFSYYNRLKLYEEIIKKIDEAEYHMLDENLVPIDLNKNFKFATSISKAQARELYKKSSIAIQHNETGMIYFKVEDKIVNINDKNGVYTISNENSYSNDIFNPNNNFFNGNAIILKTANEIKEKKIATVPQDIIDGVNEQGILNVKDDPYEQPTTVEEMKDYYLTKEVKKGNERYQYWYDKDDNLVYVKESSLSNKLTMREFLQKRIVITNQTELNFNDIGKWNNSKKFASENQNSNKQKLTQLPLDSILKNHGYDEIREKSSRNSKVVSNGIEKLVINRVKSGDYLYFVAGGQERGNIYNFAKNRGIKANELLENIDLNTLTNHNIAIGSNSYNPTFVTEHEESKSYNQTDMNYLRNERYLNKDILKQFDSIKIDKYKNAVFPVYTVEKMEDENGKEKIFFTISGLSKKLANPITKDKEGKYYDKPIKTLDYGKKGISVLLPNQTDMQNITRLILGESSIDNLSNVQINKIPLNNTALISFNGNMGKDSLEAFKYVIENASIKEIVKAFDNDKEGFKYDKQIDDIVKSSKADIKTTISKSKTKDWNEDLKAIKIEAKRKALEMGFEIKQTQSQQRIRA